MTKSVKDLRWNISYQSVKGPWLGDPYKSVRDLWWNEQHIKGSLFFYTKKVLLEKYYVGGWFQIEGVLFHE